MSLLQHPLPLHVVTIVIARDNYVLPIPPAPSVLKYVLDALLPNYLYKLAVH